MIAAFFKANPIIAWLLSTVVVAVAGTGTYVYVNKNQEGTQQVASLTSSGKVGEPAEPVAKPEGTPPAASVPQNETSGQPAEMALVEPRFDVLRVEKDGSAVIAGSAPASSTVEIMSGGDVVATAKAGPNGDFAIVLDNPLPAGSYELAIKATAQDGKEVMSSETGIVSIPESGGELIAMVTKQGEASRIIQAPKSEEPAAEQKMANAEPAPAAKQPAVVAEKPAAEVETKPEEEKPAVMAKAEPAPEAAPASEAPVLVKAVDVDGGKIFVAGSGEPGRNVNIYLDGKLLGSSTVGPEGGFLVEADGAVTPGNHEIRADMLASGSADVTDRAVVPLVHEAPQETPKETTVATAEPAPEKPMTTEDKPAATEEKPAKVTEEKPAEDKPAMTAEDKPMATEEKPAMAAQEQPAATEEKPAMTAEQTAPKQEEVASAKPAEAIRTGANVIIRRGDNLWTISRRMLGTGTKYTVIYEANRNQIRNPHWIYPGQVFDVPGAEKEMPRG